MEMERDGMETAPEADPARERISRIVQAWLMDNIHGSPVSQSTAAWNHLYASLPDLVDRLTQSMEE